MNLFFRRLTNNLSDLMKEPLLERDPIYVNGSRVIEYDTDYSWILKYSKHILILNAVDVSNLKNVTVFKSPTRPQTLVMVPTTMNVVGLKRGYEWYAYPYVLISERPMDLRLVVFENVEYLNSWLNAITNCLETDDFDILTRPYLDHARFIRMYSHADGKFFTDKSVLKDIIDETETYASDDVENELSKVIKNRGEVDVIESKDLLKREIDEHTNFIKKWSIKNDH